MTMEEAHKQLLKSLEDTFLELMVIHADPSYLNWDASEYNDTLKEFNGIQKKIFLFKDLWHEINETKN